MVGRIGRGRFLCEPVALSVHVTGLPDAGDSSGAGLPLWIDYRGRLTDAFGVPQHGSFEMVFRIADDGGAELPAGTPWSERHACVEVINGFFRVPLGSASPFPRELFGSGPLDEAEPPLRFLDVTVERTSRVGFVANAEAYTTPNSLIPNVIHFIFFGETPFRFLHYLAILSAYRRARPDAIYLYAHREPEQNEWWERAKQLVTIEHVEPPHQHRGKALKYYQYKADVVRIEKLLERGGIYLDIDVLTLRAFDRLRTYPCVVGGERYVEGREGSYSRNPDDFASITNAVLMSVPGSPFLQAWYEELEIDDNTWAGHAVGLPLEIVRKHPGIAHVEPVESFMPFDFRDAFIFREMSEEERTSKAKTSLGRSYCVHLWETLWDESYLQEIGPEYLRTRCNIFVDLFGDLNW